MIALPSGDNPATNNPIAPVAASRRPSTARFVRISQSPASVIVTNAFDGVRKNQTIFEMK